MINPSLSTHFNLLIASARMISFLQGQIKDVHQYVVILEFTHFVDEKDIQRTEGIVMIGLRCKQFRYVQQSKTIEGIVEIDGEINAPMIVMRMKKVKN